MEILLWSAFVMGLIGNLHCLGMCGPLALAIPIKRSTIQQRLLSISLYNTGRITIYSTFGAVLGLLGKAVVITGFQQYFSILIGTLIILGVVFPFFMKQTNVLKASLFSSVGKIKNVFGRLLTKRSYSSLFAIGIMNGLLPCGLVYMALAGAILSGSWKMGAAYMVLFGIGTLPVMFALPYFGQFLSTTVRTQFRKLIPVTLILFGILLILRGSNLGIPYLSPQVEPNQSCCKIKCH